MKGGNTSEANVLGRNFRKYCERTGVKFTPYQIRHSFATFYLENGGDLFTLQRQMGHTDLQMTKRYTEILDKLIVEVGQAVSVCRIWWTVPLLADGEKSPAIQ